MSKALVIVESPAKIKTLQKILGPDFIFESSLGHVRDLPKRSFGIDTENNFEPEYEPLEDKEQVIAKLQKACAESDVVYLSPDPDREGEAIAWHIAALLPEGTNIRRVAFNSITKEAVLNAVANPSEIDMALVNAQQARRLLDRIVGYKISPILARRVQRRGQGSISAGRVQSVALKLVVDREKEIDAFLPVEYWNLAAWLLPEEAQVSAFRSHLYSVDGKRIEKEIPEGKEDKFLIINNKETADSIVKRLEKASYTVTRVEKKEKKRNPVPPFITSTLQQEASRYYGFSSSRTMSIAQGLYEGIDLGKDGREGLITYMRTDSVRTAPEALDEARAYILDKYGKEYVPESPKIYSSKKTAQDAHEAIRPTSLMHPPDALEQFLTRDQHRLYFLIWRRFVASQMTPAVFDTVSADISTKDNIVMRASGSTMKFRGFLALYEERHDDEEQAEDDGKTLPELTVDQILSKDRITSEQSFTKPPPRFTEASLVKELEKSGIGRPSTYATIMNKIQSRDYSEKENGRLKPTELGKVIAQMLEANFQQIMNIDFTVNMENELELIAENKKDWRELIKEFWDDFIPTVEIAEKEAFVPKLMTELECPKCKEAKLQKIWSRSKYFYGCSGYPDCDYTAPLEELTFDKTKYADDFNWEQACPNCEGEMKVRHGRFGAFLGCTKYPDCRGIINIPKKGEEDLSKLDMPTCPAKGCDGRLAARRSRFGKIFFSCSSFPDCDVIVNNLDDVATKYADHEKTAYVKKARGKKAAATKKTKAKAKAKTTKAKKTTSTRKSPMVTVSDTLSPILGASEMTRGEVMKKLWEYIKTKDLQDPENKRTICPDDALAGVFGSSDPIDMFKMTGVVSKHLTSKKKTEES